MSYGSHLSLPAIFLGIVSMTYLEIISKLCCKQINLYIIKCATFTWFFFFLMRRNMTNGEESLRFFFKLDAFNFPSRCSARDHLIHFQRADWNLSMAPSISLEAWGSSELVSLLGSAGAALRLHWFVPPTMIVYMSVTYEKQWPSGL